MDDIFQDLIDEASGDTTEIPFSELKQYDKEGVARMMKLWKRFAQNLPSPFKEVETVEPFKTPPSLIMIQTYFKWRTRTGVPRLDQKITVHTLRKEWEQFQRTVLRANNHTYSVREVRSMIKFINDLHGSEGASRKRRAKSIAFFADSQDVIRYQWCCDEYTYAHPRMMMQITWYILLSSYWGLRPGECVESTSHRKTNQGITYGDCTLSLFRKNGQLCYELKIILRYRKFKRNTGETQTITLREDVKNRHLCAITWFLCMAVADEVFMVQETLADFDKRSIGKTASSRQFAIKEGKKNLPLCRALEGKKISDDKMMSASSLAQYIKDLGQRCGYQETLTCYSFRRGFGNEIEGKVSTHKTRQAMSHRDDRTFRSYVTTTIGIDTQNIVHGLPEDKEYINFTRSIGFSRDSSAPKPHGSSLSNQTSIIPQHLLSELAAKYPDLSDSELARRARKKQDHGKRADFYANKGLETMDIEDPVESDTPASLIEILPSPFFNLMLKYNTRQAAAIGVLWSMEPTTFSQFEPLQHLADPSKFRPYYPQPIQPPTSDLCCPYCKLDICGRRDSYDPMHILRCHEKYKGELFCFDCAKCYKKGRENGHEHKHEEMHNTSCAEVYWRGLLIRHGRCPLCRTYKQHHKFKHHMEKCGKTRAYCKECKCKLPSKSELQAHLYEVHCISLGKRESKR